MEVHRSCLSVPARDRAVPLVSPVLLSIVPHSKQKEATANLFGRNLLWRWDCEEGDGEMVCSLMQTVTGWSHAWWPVPSLCDPTLYLTSFPPFFLLSVLSFSCLYHPQPPNFFPPSQSVHREWLFSSHVTFCLNTIAGVCHWPIFLWKSVGFPGDGEWRHHFTFLCSCPPPSPLHCS